MPLSPCSRFLCCLLWQSVFLTYGPISGAWALRRRPDPTSKPTAAGDVLLQIQSEKNPAIHSGYAVIHSTYGGDAMKVILRETIEPLGIAGAEVDVKKGYARNYLVPQGKAVYATPQNRKFMEQQRAKIDLQIARERKMAEELAQRLDGVVCRIQAKAADETRLYGSVSTRDIADALGAQGIEVPKRMILLKNPIKEVGTYQVPIRVY